MGNYCYVSNRMQFVYVHRIQRGGLDWYMTKPLVDVQEDPTGICVSTGCIQQDKVIAFGFNNGIWIGIRPRGYN
jgi:hypothetical protein